MQAKSLNDLLEIRAHNKSKIEAINGNLGSALGLKRKTGQASSSEPAIIIFVPFKINNKWLPPSQRIPKKLRTPGGKWCHVDVVEGSKAEFEDIVFPDYSALGERLRGWDDQIWVGSQISHWTNQSLGDFSMGTLGCFVKERNSGEVGILTNKHVAIKPGQIMHHPVPWGVELGITNKVIEDLPDEKWYGPHIDEKDGFVRVDAAFVKLKKGVDQQSLNPQLMDFGELGKVKDIDLNDMSIIGQKVQRVGRTTGLRFGTIEAFGYEWHDEAKSIYTDLLIVGSDGIPFSTKGDSGSLIITDDDQLNPIGLLWGGWQEKLANGFGQENWTYATGLKRILDALDLELVRKFNNDTNTSRNRVESFAFNKPNIKVKGEDNLGEAYIVQSGEPRLITYKAVQNHAIIEGDVVIGSLRFLEDINLRVRERALSISSVMGNIWPDATIPYEIDRSINFRESRIIAAMDLWKPAGMRFVKRNRSHRNYIKFILSSSYGSQVGMNGGEQPIFTMHTAEIGKLAHEVGHAIGLYHEHSRPDRDEPRLEGNNRII